MNQVENVIITKGDKTSSRGIADYGDTFVKDGVMWVCVYLFDEIRASYIPTDAVMIEE